MQRRWLLLAFLCVTLGTFSACASRSYAIAPGPPPPPRAAFIGRAPGPGFLWADGYWDRRGNNWHWVSGSWLRPPRARAAWVPGHWSQHGRSYRFHPGHWR